MGQCGFSELMPSYKKTALLLNKISQRQCLTYSYIHCVPIPNTCNSIFKSHWDINVILPQGWVYQKQSFLVLLPTKEDELM